MRRGIIALCIGVLLVIKIAGVAAAMQVLNPTSPENVLPEELSVEDWAIIHEQFRQAEYEVTRYEPSGIHRAGNREHGWNMVFTDTGVRLTSRRSEDTWSWGLTLTRYGYESQFQAVAGPAVQTVEANRINFHWDENLTEWYVNDTVGLKQNFTLAASPSSAGSLSPSPLILEMKLYGTLTPELRDEGKTILFRDAAGQPILSYGTLIVTDATGRRLPAHLSLTTHEMLSSEASNAVRIVIDDTGATYPLLIDPLIVTEQAKLIPYDATGSDYFGSSVAISGITLVVGAPGNGDTGVAYIFKQNQSGDWYQVKKLTPANSVTNQSFGSSVAIDGNTIVVGASGYNNIGAAYVFDRHYGGDDHWGQIKELTPSTYPCQAFGHSVAISGDTIVVGVHATLSDSSAKPVVFERNWNGPDNWGEVTQLVPNDGATSWSYGWRVAISGDTIVTGEPDDGTAYIFERNHNGLNNWGQVKKLTPSSGDPFPTRFGWSVAIDGHTIVVGAPLTDSPYINSCGAIHIFDRHQGNWDRKKRTAPSCANGTRFGWSVGISGDTVIAGAPHDGNVFTFERNLGGTDNWGWNGRDLFPLGGPYYGDLGFGFSVAINGDIAIVGTPMVSDYNMPSTGAAYMFGRNQNDIWDQTEKLSIARTMDKDGFGRSVASSGDIVVVGAPYDRDNDGSAGAAYIFAQNQDGPNNWGQMKKLFPSDSEFSDWFGYTVAISGDTVVIGAPGKNLFSGAAYIFARNQGGTNNWGQVKKLKALDSDEFDDFGWSVTISEDENTIVVGARYAFDDNDVKTGAAYIFARNQGGPNNWGQMTKLLPSNGETLGKFGNSVAISGDTVVVGSEFYGNNASGAAYIFQRTPDNTYPWFEEIKVLLPPVGSTEGRFGASVAISDVTVVVGMPGNYLSSGGRACIFGRNQDGPDNWGMVEALAPPSSDRRDDNRFGESVAISGNIVAVGAPGVSQEENWFNAVYVFTRNQSAPENWDEGTTVPPANDVLWTNFGRSVAIGGNILWSTIMVGAPSDYARNQPPLRWKCGAAYIYAVAPIFGELELAFDRGSDPSTSMSFVYRGDTIAYMFTATNLFEDGVSLMISAALDAYLDYVAGTLSVTVNDMPVTRDDMPSDFLLGYRSGALAYGDTLAISFDVMISDIAPINSVLESMAMLSVYDSPDSQVPFLVTESNVLRVRVREFIPEPATILLLGAGLLGLFVFMRGKLSKRK